MLTQSQESESESEMSPEQVKQKQVEKLQGMINQLQTKN